MTILLSTENLSKTFIQQNIFGTEKHTVVALNNVTMSINYGEIVGIVGESGSGKSTLAKIICSLINADSGNIIIEGKNSNNITHIELSEIVQMIFQDPANSLSPRMHIKATLEEAILSIPKKNRASKILHVLSLVGLDNSCLQKYPHQLSGGQAQRVAIARALLKNPKLIIADEAISSVDVSMQNQLLSYFKFLKDNQKMAILFITHDISAASSIADRIIVMKDGRIVEEGETQELINNPKDAYTKNLIESIPKLTSVCHPDEQSEERS